MFGVRENSIRTVDLRVLRLGEHQALDMPSPSNLPMVLGLAGSRMVEGLRCLMCRMSLAR